MRSTAVYKALREAWDDVLSEAGFRRVPGNRGAAWWRAEPDGNLLFWAGVDNQGWDPFRGSSFSAVFELSVRLEPTWSHPDLRGALGEDFDPQTLLAALAQQNAVIARLPLPLGEELPPEGHDRDFYMREFFAPVTDLSPHDMQFRYLTEGDVREWATLLRPLLVDSATKFLARLRDGR